MRCEPIKTFTQLNLWLSSITATNAQFVFRQPLKITKYVLIPHFEQFKNTSELDLNLVSTADVIQNKTARSFQNKMILTVRSDYHVGDIP